MLKSSLFFNNHVNADLNVYVKGLYDIPIPQPIYEDITLSSGKKLTKYKGFEDVTIPIVFNILDYRSLHQTVSDFTRWIRNIEDNKLQLFTDPEYYYLVKKINTSSNFQRTFKSLGQCELDFVCDAYRRKYLDLEYYQIRVGEKIYNDGDIIAEPIIKIYGNGNVTLTINNKSIVVNVGGNVIINSEKKLVYKEDGTMQNISMSGEFPILEKGYNDISWTISDGGTITKITINRNRRYL